MKSVRWMLGMVLLAAGAAGAQPESQSAPEPASQGSAPGTGGAGGPSAGTVPPPREKRSHLLGGRPVSGVPPVLGGRPLSGQSHPGAPFVGPFVPLPGRRIGAAPSFGHFVWMRPGSPASLRSRWGLGHGVPGVLPWAHPGVAPHVMGFWVPRGAAGSLRMPGTRALPAVHPALLKFDAVRPPQPRIAVDGSTIRIRPSAVDGTTVRPRHGTSGAASINGTDFHVKH